MPSIRRAVAFVVAVVSGILLLFSGIHGPTGTYQLVIDKLPNFIGDPQVLQIVNTLAAVLIAIALAGGFAVIAGGLLILVNHVGTGKIILSIGTGIGIPWLILLLITLFTTQQVAALVAQYGVVGWAGIILAIVARTIAK